MKYAFMLTTALATCLCAHLAAAQGPENEEGITAANVAAVINEWYRLHIGDGGPADATQEELIAEALAENAFGGGFSYPPGRA